MASKGIPISRDYSIGDSSETSFPERPIPEEKVTEYLYPVDNEVVDDLRRITRSYAKKIGGFPIIPTFPRRELHKKDHP